MLSKILLVHRNSWFSIFGYSFFLFVGLCFVSIFVTGLFLRLVEFISGFKLNEGITYLVIASSILGLIVSFNTVGLLIILLAILCCGLFVWSILSRSFELNNEGIGYKTLSGARAFYWDEIEVVEVKTRGKELKIWARGRFTRVKLTTLTLEDQTLLRESFLTQIYTRGIPVCYSETRF